MKSRLITDSIPATWWSSTASTNSSREARSWFVKPVRDLLCPVPRRPPPGPTHGLRMPRPPPRHAPAEAARAQHLHEPLAAIHPPADCDLAVYGRHPAHRRRCLPPTARLCVTSGRLPHHPSHHVLPGREPRGDGVVRDRAARTSIRPGPRPESNDVDQFIGRIGHYTAVHSRPEHRRGGAAGASRHQRRRNLPSERSSQPAHLRENESG